ncbi:diguanylate cyclase [Aeromicrobium sp. SMF47]|uniref:Diguanylate cyclase n=1 Tax=Aeromicrobium yanjiei TaxID=2662028 RepID=A0A5Q2MIH9_9ACTN|nr:GGDEF domain-containing protein [Aeromicrobium yanjiei]MRJ75441.1 diguanylate cyclase [Aeromicrobium yanjiei]QGG40115.1 diguanylate cyclase [Aeromicrobium yanjiei]
MRTEAQGGRLTSLPGLAGTTALMYAVSSALLISAVITWQPGKNPRWAFEVLAVVAVSFLAWVLARGPRFTQQEALAMTAVLLAVIGCLTWTTHLLLGAFANGTALPIVAVYVIWYLRPGSGRVVLFLGVAWWFIAIAHHGDGAVLPLAAAVVVQTVIATEVFARIKGRMDDLARRDHLTGALNRRGITEVLDRELEQSARRSQPISVVAIDLDGLRAVNNTRGHGAGDDLLEAMATHWSGHLRRQDAVGRVGGDEFLIVLPATSKEQAEQIVERMASGSPGSWSAGVAEAKVGDSAHTMIERADRRMYAAKAARQRA